MPEVWGPDSGLPENRFRGVREIAPGFVNGTFPVRAWTPEEGCTTSLNSGRKAGECSFREGGRDLKEDGKRRTPRKEEPARLKEK